MFLAQVGDGVTAVADKISIWIGLILAVGSLLAMILRQAERIIKLELEIQYLKSYVFTEVAQLPRRKSDRTNEEAQ